MDAEDIVAGTASPAFVSDEKGRIVAINGAATRLLGHAPEDVLGKPCHRILCGHDRFGNRFCHERCAVGTMARRKESINCFEIDVKTASGEPLRASFSVLVVNGQQRGEYGIIHMFTPMNRAERPSSIEAPPPASPALPGTQRASSAIAAAVAKLTPREREILRLLAQGKNCTAISGGLQIKLSTVRNHIQTILRKLNVHSQLEAVALVHRATR